MHSGLATLIANDMPGLIQSAGADGDAADIQLVRNLVVQYISKPSAIILVTVVCESEVPI